MPPTSELFRFVTLRPADRVLMHRIESRLIRDRRASSSVRGTLFGPGEFEAKLAAAAALAPSLDFLDEAEPAMPAIEPVLGFFPGALRPRPGLLPRRARARPPGRRAGRRLHGVVPRARAAAAPHAAREPPGGDEPH